MKKLALIALAAPAPAGTPAPVVASTPAPAPCCAVELGVSDNTVHNKLNAVQTHRQIHNGVRAGVGIKF